MPSPFNILPVIKLIFLYNGHMTVLRRNHHGKISPHMAEIRSNGRNQCFITQKHILWAYDR